MILNATARQIFAPSNLFYQLGASRAPTPGGDPNEITAKHLAAVGLHGRFATLSGHILDGPQNRPFDYMALNLLASRDRDTSQFGYDQPLRAKDLADAYQLLRDHYDFALLDVTSQPPSVHIPLYENYFALVQDFGRRWRQGEIESAGFGEVAAFDVRGFHVVVLRRLPVEPTSAQAPG
jgi:hypothetical protein